MTILPNYVTRPADSVHLQPYACRNTQLYGFYLRADKDVIQLRMVDPILNAPSGGAPEYRTFTDLVLMSFARAEHCTSTLPPASGMGWTVEYSWTLWVPLVVVKRELGIEVAQRVVFYPAYICVDNSWSLAAGREVYGFPKCYGPLTIPAASDPKATFSATTLVIPTFGADSPAQMLPLIAVTQTAINTGAQEVWQDLKDAVGAIGHMLSGSGSQVIVPGFSLILDLFHLAANEEVPGVFLKQFRDAADGNKACFQAIVEAGSFVEKFRGGGLLDGTFEATLADFDSHPLARDMGVGTGPQRLEFPFWVNFDFVINPGTNVWEAR
ncbi:MAG: acetoacetate decarboxylase family protein [Proteobacteria bacterium]|nr:acetoacetate decarboxylase family protein [Pseudomonadota bacterium]